MLPIAGGELRPIDGVAPGEWVIQTSIDGTEVYLRHDTDFEAQIVRLDPATGRRYVLGYTQQLSELYLSRQIR